MKQQALTVLCPKACSVVMECESRVRPQSFTCRDPKTRSQLTVTFRQSAQGVVFVTDHVIPGNGGLSCDWCVCHCDANKTRCDGLLVELKGRKFKHAVEQLASTYSAMKNTWPQLCITQCCAVLSGCHIPSISSGDYKVVDRYRLPNFKHMRTGKELSL